MLAKHGAQRVPFGEDKRTLGGAVNGVRHWAHLGASRGAVRGRVESVAICMDYTSFGGSWQVQVLVTFCVTPF